MPWTNEVSTSRLRCINITVRRTVVSLGTFSEGSAIQGMGTGLAKLLQTNNANNNVNNKQVGGVLIFFVLMHKKRKLPKAHSFPLFSFLCFEVSIFDKAIFLTCGQTIG